MDFSDAAQEAPRLNALHRYQVLDTLPEVEFDRITRFVKHLLNVPVVLINLVDAKRTWIKSAQGTAVRELDRANACCSITITSDAVFTVPDLLAHPDLTCEALLVQQGLRSYAGAPLVTPDGHRIGSLAVYDYRPRAFSTPEQQFLQDLAAIVIDSLELRLMVLLWRDAQHQSAYLAHHDALTGLPNRLRLLDRAQLAFHQAGRTGCSVGFMVLDLDGFKNVNDSLGHSVGDDLLKEVGRRLCASVRADDTVARFGGDEFVILLPELTEPLDAARVAQKLLDCLHEPLKVDQYNLELSASVGIAVYPVDGLRTDTVDPVDEANALLHAADTAMYEAKAAGKAQYRFYGQEMTLRAQRKLVLRTRLAQAIGQGELALHYQPQVNLQTGQVVGMEALARWPQADGSWISPLEFIALAEESHLIHELGAWVLRTACGQLMQWQRQGTPEWTLSVNVSVKQWEDPHFLALVQQTLTETGFPPSRLVLEVTESVMLSSPQEARLLSEAFAALGVKVALDDFGTGYSSLSQMQELAIEQLKVDRSFVRRLGEAPKARAVAETMILLGQRLGITVVGEGVETDEQRAYLRELACDLGQGYLFGRPVPPIEFIQKYAG